MSHGDDSTFIITHGGTKFWPLDPRPADIHIEDIAHALSNICRWGGHTAWHFSVAQHCCLVVSCLKKYTRNPIILIQGLLHDSAESYLGDVVRPLKAVNEEYRKQEEKLLQVIFTRFNIPEYNEKEILHPLIHDADYRILQLEAQQLVKGTNWLAGQKRASLNYDKKITHWSPNHAKKKFYETYLKLEKSADWRNG